MDKLKELIEISKYGCLIQVNQHREFEMSVSEYVKEAFIDDLDDDLFVKMVETDSFIQIMSANEEPNTHWVVYHYDLDIAIDEALRLCKEDN